MKEKIDEIVYNLELGCIDWQEASEQLFDLYIEEHIEVKKLLNNRGLICATIDEVILMTVKNLAIHNISQQSELLDLLTEIANSDTLYSNTRHKLIAKKLLSSNCY